jgi:hypothetical protein
MNKRTANLRGIDIFQSLTVNIIDAGNSCRRRQKILSAKGLDGGRAARDCVKLAMWLAIVAIVCSHALAEDTLQQDFIAPPVNAKPAVWWFWGETVTTDHGVVLHDVGNHER